ncbi:MAG: methionyl-tRNA formyltransferase [Alphaproteobacteria bacterium]|nr:methionyl-tRNA formyltransferase [Alphaproteobacteria bacterium]
MAEAKDIWWSQKPRTVSVVVDNANGWFVKYAHPLCEQIKQAGDHAVFCRAQSDVPEGHIAFYLSCVNITQPEIMARNKVNLVCHASDLPNGRGFSPVTWQVLEGKNDIPFCLFEMEQGLDSGPVVYRDVMHLRGNELNDEIREAQGQKTIEICMKYLKEPALPAGVPQTGPGSLYARRGPKDGELALDKTLEEQVALLRISDNENYPAFFHYRGRKYILKITAEE